MARFLRKAGLLAVMGVLVTGLTSPASADETTFKCQTNEAGATGQSSAECTALGQEMSQDCPDSSCTEVVTGVTELGRMAAAVLVANGACREEPGTRGECTAVDIGPGTPSPARVTIKVSYSCCPSEWNIEIIISTR